MDKQIEALRMAAVLEAFQAQWDKEHTEELILLRQTNQALVEALELAVRQNSHDMLMTGDELRTCEAALAKARRTE
jgi:hypothetical protein